MIILKRLAWSPPLAEAPGPFAAPVTPPRVIPMAGPGVNGPSARVSSFSGCSSKARLLEAQRAQFGSA